MSPTNYVVASFTFVVVQLIFGLLSVLTVLAFQLGYLPLFFVATRLCMAIPAIWICAYCSGRTLPWNVKGNVWKSASVAGVIGIGISAMTLVYAVYWTSPVTTSLFLQLIPIVMCVIGSARGEERMSLLKLSAIVVSFAGCAVMVLDPFSGSVVFAVSVPGLAAIAINITANASFLVLQKRLVGTGIDTITLSAVSITAGGAFVVFCSVIVFAFIQPTPPQDFAAPWLASEPSAIGILVLLYASLGATCGVFLLISFGLKRSDSSFSSLFMPLQPLFTAVFASLVINSSPSTSQIVGGALVMLGLSTVLWVRRQEYMSTSAVLQNDRYGPLEEEAPAGINGGPLSGGICVRDGEMHSPSEDTSGNMET